jgi:hypothetical protein
MTALRWFLSMNARTTFWIVTVESVGVPRGADIAKLGKTKKVTSATTTRAKRRENCIAITSAAHSSFATCSHACSGIENITASCFVERVPADQACLPGRDGSVAVTRLLWEMGLADYGELLCGR